MTRVFALAPSGVMVAVVVILAGEKCYCAGFSCHKSGIWTFVHGSGSDNGTMWSAVVAALMAMVLMVTPVGGTIFITDVAFKNIFVLLLPLLLLIFLFFNNVRIFTIIIVVILAMMVMFISIVMLAMVVMVVNIVMLASVAMIIITAVGAMLRLLDLFAAAML